jgi:hypothetical protein
VRSAGLVRCIVLLILLFALPGLAQAPTESVLTNADIVKMMKAGLSESIILREIHLSRTDFSTSPSALIELQKQGASEKILGAVLDSRTGTFAREPEPHAMPRIVAQVTAPGLRHLPSFEAGMRINSTTTGKVSVGHNQINVERSGVPVFSLKWNEVKNTNSGK